MTSTHLPMCPHIRHECQHDCLYVSGSAYKIVKDRAYHHGTMLISSQLNTLGDVLHSTKVDMFPETISLVVHIAFNKASMVTKGVASVRSPVRNLNELRPDVSHEDFVDALTRAFREQYGVDKPVCIMTVSYVSRFSLECKHCHRSIQSRVIPMT